MKDPLKLIEYLKPLSFVALLRSTLCLVCLMLIVAHGTARADVEKRRQELIEILDEELKEVTRLNKQTGASRPEMLLRMGQILLEKGRILRDQENQKYLEISLDERIKINKDEQFKNSKRYFEQAQKTVLVLLSKFKNFDEKAEAYYILAYNAKEQKEDEKAKKYFEMSLKATRSESIISMKSRIALAEIYFNRGFYDKALELYEVALKDKSDKWWTKDAFNLGWCYFKTGKYDKAISILNESYELSKGKKYIDMTKSIERDIAYFYTEASRIREAVEFYRKANRNISEVLLKVGKYLKSQGKFSSAEKALTEGLQFKATDSDEVELNLELLSLYDKFGKEQNHLDACKALVRHFDKGLLSKEQIDILKFNAQKTGALIQKGIVEKTFNHNQDLLKRKTQAAVTYFMILAKISPEKSETPFYLSGETFYSIGDYDNAIVYYGEAIKLAKRNKNQDIEKKASSSLLSCLANGVKKENEDKYLVSAYESYLSSNPKGDKASLIYQRLYTTYYTMKDIPNALSTLNRFRQNFPTENGPQERMLAELMDYYKTQNSQKELIELSNRIENGEFVVTPEFKSKVKALAMSLQFEKVEEASSKGDKKSALKGYFKIYKDPNTSAEAKKTSAYNIAVLFYETNDGKNLSLWADRALSMMKVEEVIRFEKDFILFTTDLFQRRMFQDSASLSEKLFDRTCNSASANVKTFFKNANVIYIAEKQFEKSRAIISKAKTCGVDKLLLADANLDLLNELASSQKWSSFSELLKSLEGDKDLAGLLISPVYIMATELESIGRIEESKNWQSKILSFYNLAKKNKVMIPPESLDVVAQVKLTNLQGEFQNLKLTQLKFPETIYNQTLKSKLKILESITNLAIEIAEVGSGNGIIRAYKLLTESHDYLAQEITQFQPEGKSPEYITSFKKGMKTITDPIIRQSNEFRQAAVKKIQSDQILSVDNFWFLSKSQLQVVPEFYPEFSEKSIGALMDKGGAQ